MTVAQLYEYTKNIELYNLNGWIIWHISCILKKLLYKNKSTKIKSTTILIVLCAWTGLPISPDLCSNKCQIKSWTWAWLLCYITRLYNDSYLSYFLQQSQCFFHLYIDINLKTLLLVFNLKTLLLVYNLVHSRCTLDVD